MRSTRALVSTLAVVAAGALLAQCQLAPSPTPSPTPCPTCPEYSRRQWGTVVLYEEKGVCTLIAGVYNNCSREATVEIVDLRKSPTERDGFTYAKTWDQIREVKEKRKEHKALNPFEDAGKALRVPAKGIDDIVLRVKPTDQVETGLYTYVVSLNGKPDEGDILIWP